MDWLTVVCDDLYGRVLPFWARHSIDKTHGGFFNCLDEDGGLYDTKVRVNSPVECCRKAVCKLVLPTPP